MSLLFNYLSLELRRGNVMINQWSNRPRFIYVLTHFPCVLGLYDSRSGIPFHVKEIVFIKVPATSLVALAR